MTATRPALAHLATISRNICIAAAAMIGLASQDSAIAADGAALNVIGYSADSRYFAFEQYGLQDGSGFAYWDVFIVDLEKNEWVKGSPVRALIKDEDNAKLSDARAEARAGADPILKDKAITEPAQILAANPANEVVADRSRITFDRWYVAMGSMPDGKGSNGIRHELSLEAIPLPLSAGCSADNGENFGFSLTLKDVSMGMAHAIHKDTSIPASRQCPYGYDLSAVVAPAGLTDTDRLVAIVGIYSWGFEGADHKFMAVPFVLSD